MKKIFKLHKPLLFMNKKKTKIINDLLCKNNSVFYDIFSLLKYNKGHRRIHIDVKYTQTVLFNYIIKLKA